MSAFTDQAYLACCEMYRVDGMKFRDFTAVDFDGTEMAMVTVTHPNGLIGVGGKRPDENDELPKASHLACLDLKRQLEESKEKAA